MKFYSKFCLVCLLFVLLVLLGVSCYKGDFSVSSVVAQPYVKTSDGTMGLSLYVTGSVPSDDGLTMVATSPDGALSWSFSAKKAIIDEILYYGSSSLAMPSSSTLPTGLWTLTVYYKDGRTLDLSFEVSYRDVSGALERNSLATQAVFDEISNLVVIV